MLFLKAACIKLEKRHNSNMKNKKNLYLGVMSGTSLDGIDIILIEKPTKLIKVVGSIYAPYSKSFKEKFFKLSFSSLNELTSSSSK